MIMGTEKILLMIPEPDIITLYFFLKGILYVNEDLLVSGTSPCYLFSSFESCIDFPSVKYVELLSA